MPPPSESVVLDAPPSESVVLDAPPYKDLVIEAKDNDNFDVATQPDISNTESNDLTGQKVNHVVLLNKGPNPEKSDSNNENNEKDSAHEIINRLDPMIIEIYAKIEELKAENQSVQKERKELH